jgi:outer membrane protein
MMKVLKTSYGERITWSGLVWMVIFLWPLAVKPESLPKVFTLKESLQWAFKESPALRSAQTGIQEAEYKKKEAKTNFLPKLSTQYSYSHLNNAPILRIPPPLSTLLQQSELPVGTNDNYNFNITLDQPIFTGFALTRTYELAALGLDISKIKFEEQELSLAYMVEEAYLNILRAQKFQIVAEQTVNQITDHVRQAQNFYDQGLIPLNDLLKSQVQLADARQNLIRSDNKVLLAKANFNTLLRIPLDYDSEVEDILRYHSFSRTLEECQTEALQKRPEIKEIEGQIKVAEKNIQLAQSDYLPRLSLQGQYLKAGDNPSVSGSPFVNSDNWSVAAMVKWNFWEWGRSHYLVEERTMAREQVKESLTQIKDAIHLEVKEAYLALREAEKNIGVAEKSIRQAEENFRISEVRYQEQVSTSLELLDAQTLLTQANNNYYQALYAYNLARFRLQKATGVYSLE